MSQYSISREELTPNLINEMLPLVGDNHQESGHTEEVNIDWEAYLELGDALCAFTLRIDDELEGMLFFLVMPYPHNKELWCANQVTFFVRPEWRKYSLSLMKSSEEYFKEYGINMIQQSARKDTPFEKILKKRGYEEIDVVYAKRLN